jgi:hypothetical protein
MADPVGEAVLTVVQSDCKSMTCPYRKGDGEVIRAKFKNKLEKKLEYRVADGNAVRKLEARIKVLEGALEKLFDKVSMGERLSPKDLLMLKDVLKPKKESSKV